ncbi:MAG: sigma 54-interacting transcriptional regulator [Clostridiales bacterium]|nr:sigma 54-interacting transcriptional regulator [Clostridiales bacterium]
MNKNDLFDIRSIGDYITDGIFICDKDGIIQYVNQSNEHISGILRDECIGKHISTFTNDPNNKIQNTVVQELLENSKKYISSPNSPQQKNEILELGSPIFSDNGKLLGAIVIDHDISLLLHMESTISSSKEQISSLEDLNFQKEQIINLLNRTSSSGNRITNWNSRAMMDLSQSLLTAARTDVTILLLGETGVGKEVFAQEILEHSSRRDQPMIKINCAAIPSELIESELFGYTKGAFTGANRKGKPGAFELANHGTLLLDEIGELPLNAQTKLLRAIQEREITRIGASQPTKVDFRLIAATNQNLEEKVRRGEFRADLYYRLNVIPIRIPSLKERPEDIPLLMEHFRNKFNRKYKKSIRFTDDIFTNLSRYEWPGNIREMENIIERWCVLYPDGSVLKWSDIHPEFQISKFQEGFEGYSMSELIENYERKIITWGIQKYGTMRKMAEAMDVHYSTISKMCKRLHLNVKDIPAVKEKS